MKKVITIMVLAFAVSAIALPSMQVQINTSSVYQYNATVVTGPIGVYDVDDSFQTFCLERSEHTANATFDVVLNDKAIDGGVGPAGDPLDTRTAFLYNEFLNGGLGSFGIVAGDYESAKVLQNVVWYLEDEGAVISMTSGTAADLLNYANANADGSNYGIRVMNMYVPDTDIKAQDMMVKVIPTPGAVVLGSIGVALVGWLRRRKIA